MAPTETEDAWHDEPMPKWSLREATTRDNRIAPFSSSGLGVGVQLTERGSWRYVQGLVHDLELSTEVPQTLRGRVEAVRLLHVYGYFQIDFFTLVSGEAALAMEMALRVRFMQRYPSEVPLRLVRGGKPDETATVPISSFDDVAAALRPRGKFPSRNGWRLEGVPEFDGSLLGLYLWARSATGLQEWLDDLWASFRSGIQMSAMSLAGSRPVIPIPENFRTLPNGEQDRWWEETYKPAWEVDYLENEVNLRNVSAHPNNGFNRMPNYSAHSVRHLFEFVEALFAR